MSSVRTLRLEILSENSSTFVVAAANSREPIPFETEFFKGQAMLVVRTNPIDPHFQSFFNGKRQFEVQVQGKFKREPIGEIYVGAEASNQMELGILTRSISKAALRFCGTMVNDLHSSFGDSQDKSDFELPHIVAPIFPTLDKILITPDGEPLPPLGTPFNEDLEYRKKRLKYRYIKDANVNLQTTYSFSVNTSNLDLLAWTLVGIPMCRPMDLRTFFGNSSIQLIAYEIPRTVAAKYPNSHPQCLLNYVFSMRLTPIDPDRLPLFDLPVMSSDDEIENNAEEEDLPSDETGINKSRAMMNYTPPPASMQDESEDDTDELDGVAASAHKESHEFHGTSAPSSSPMRPTATANASSHNYGNARVTMSGWLRKKFVRKERPPLGKGGVALEDFDLFPDIKESNEYVEVDYDMEAKGDLQYCSICIELVDHKHNKRKFYYMLTVHESIKTNDPRSSASRDLFPFRLKTYSEISKAIPLVSVPKIHKNKKLSLSEQRRRQIIESYRLALSSAQTKPNEFRQLKSFLLPITEVENSFLGGNITLYEKFDKDKSTIVSWEGYVALALSRRHFSEQYMIVSRDAVLVRRSSDSKRNQFSIKCDKIVSVQCLPNDYCPIADFSILQIETYSRVYYFLLRSNLQVNQWLEVFITILGNKCMNSPYRMIDFADKSQITHDAVVSTAPTLPLVSSTVNASMTSTGLINALTVGANSNPNKFEFFEQGEDSVYYERPACWKPDKRRIYNYRRIFFTNTVGDKYSAVHPNDLIVSILKTAFFLTESENTASEYDWVKFWDEISLLQVIDLRKLNEIEKTAFFLNLYHVMVLHGTLVFGPPNSGIWNAFFSNICYIVSFESISIAEMEYGILRAAMVRSSIFTGMVIASPPQTIFPGLALTNRDFRLHYAINCGSLSLIDKVPVYTPAQLDNQLDEVTRLSIDNYLEIDVNKKLVILPKLPFQDYAFIHSGKGADGIAVGGASFGPANTSNSANANTAYTHNNVIECLRAILPYLPRQKKQALMQLLTQDAQHINIKFKAVNFRCRTLKKA